MLKRKSDSTSVLFMVRFLCDILVALFYEESRVRCRDVSTLASVTSEAGGRDYRAWERD